MRRDRDISFYRIDEENEHYFRDEDSIYEVLEDGTYRLVKNFYLGKGKVLILEETSVIGAHAFSEHSNITGIEFPKALRVIEERAFYETSLKSVSIPNSVLRIESGAFGGCSDLKSVQLPEKLEYVAEDAFEGCEELKRIKSDHKRMYSFVDGIIKKLTQENKSGYEWIKGKIFVHEGLDEEDEQEFKEIVAEYGGEIRDSVSSAVDYFVFDEVYDYPGSLTKKMKRAIDLEKQGKKIKIIDINDWNDMLRDSERTSAETDVVDGWNSVTAKIDYFAKLVKDLEELELARQADIDYDELNRTISITMPFYQYVYEYDSELASERLACAENLEVGSPVLIWPTWETWEVTSVDGKSLGVLNLAKTVHSYLPHINIAISQGCIDSIKPKSKKRANARWADGAVKFEIRECSSEKLSEQDLLISEQFIYTLTDKEAILIRWIADESIKKAVIPTTVEGKPVIGIYSELFGPDMWEGSSSKSDKKVEEIVIPEGVKYLGTAALFRGDYLKTVVLPSSLEYISPDVFAGRERDYRDNHMNSETVYVAPLGSYADDFLKAYKPSRQYMDALTVINDDSGEVSEKVKNLVKKLHVFAFNPCDSGMKVGFKSGDGLGKTVVIPEEINGQPVSVFNVHRIPESVEELIIPASITTIESIGGDDIDSEMMFYSGKYSLRKVEISENNPTYWSDGFSIFTKDRKTLLKFMAYKAKKYSVPEGTEIIGRYAFRNMPELQSVTLPKSIKKLDDHAFGRCKNLAEMYGMEFVSEVGKSIFSGDSIPYVQNKDELIIGSALLKYSDLAQKTIRIPEGITKICESVFGEHDDNDQVEEILLPESIITIEKNAFRGRKKLRKVNIPEGVKRIPKGVFAYCENLEKIFIPASVEEIEISAFPVYSPATRYDEEEPCKFRAIEVDSANKKYCSVNGMLFSKDMTELFFIPNGVDTGKIEIPAGVKHLHENLAKGNNAITELTLPDSVETIGCGAFSACRKLQKVVFPEKLEEISGSAFSDCRALKTIVWPKKLGAIGSDAFCESGLEHIDLPDTVEHIGNDAFARTAIKKACLPKSVRTIGYSAFSGVPEVEIYDTIDPDAGDAVEGIDTINGHPNSLVGYIGIGRAWGMWECAANHNWLDYTITVRSAETDEIKYKVWMGADDSQRDYYCFLASAWGHNATFAFEKLDQFFPKIRGDDNKRQVAKYRLEYPHELSSGAKAKYEDFMQKKS